MKIKNLRKVKKEGGNLTSEGYSCLGCNSLIEQLPASSCIEKFIYCHRCYHKMRTRQIKKARAESEIKKIMIEILSNTPKTLL